MYIQVHNSLVTKLTDDLFIWNLFKYCKSTFASRNISLIFFFRGRKIYEPPRYMTVKQAAEQLMEIVHNKRKESDSDPGELLLPSSW